MQLGTDTILPVHRPACSTFHSARMTTGKDYPRRELRFFVHKIDAVLRKRDQGDRSYKGLLKRVQLNEQQMTQKELICAAAECGSIRVLKWLEKEEVWNPHKDTYALEAADVKGNLVELLKHFQMPLGSYPKVAQGLAFELSALDELQSTSDTSQFRAMEPTPKACLLANLLMVPGEIAENVMERIVERMTVFRRAPGGKQLKPIRSPLPRRLAAPPRSRASPLLQVLRMPTRAPPGALLLLLLPAAPWAACPGGKTPTYQV